MGTEARIFVAGHQGMVGSALIRRLRDAGYNNIITRSHAELDLTRQADVETFFADNAIDQVYLAAAKVGELAFHPRLTGTGGPLDWTMHSKRGRGQRRGLPPPWSRRSIGRCTPMLFAENAEYPRDPPPSS